MAIVFPRIKDALLGIYGERDDDSFAIYDRDLTLEILMEDHGNYEDALDWFAKNIESVYSGAETPLFVTKI